MTAPGNGGEMLERVARELTVTLRHHGVEMHPNDIRGLAWDAIAVMRVPTETMIDRFVSRALCVSVHGDGGWSQYAAEQWRAMIDAALYPFPERAPPARSTSTRGGQHDAPGALGGE